MTSPSLQPNRLFKKIQTEMHHIVFSVLAFRWSDDCITVKRGF